MLVLPTSVTGTPITGLTSPAFTLVVDNTPDPYKRKSYVSVIGGTNPTVTKHTLSSPFYIEGIRGAKMLAQPPFNAVTGMFKENVPKNKVRLYFRKGLTVLSGAPLDFGDIDVTVRVPAGAEQNDPTNVAAMYSLAAAALVQMAQGMYDTSVTGAS